MTLLRRLLYLLAHRQIEQAFAAGAEMQRAAYVAGEVIRMECVKRMAYAEGQIAGREEVLERIEAIVEERTMGMGDYISAEDLARVKRGMLH